MQDKESGMKKGGLGYRIDRCRLKIRNTLIRVDMARTGTLPILALPEDPDEDREMKRLNHLIANWEAGRRILPKEPYEIYPIPVAIEADWYPPDYRLRAIERKTEKKVIGLSQFIGEQTHKPVLNWVNVLLSSTKNHS